MPFYHQAELNALGFRRLGTDVLISSLAAIYNPGRISIGDHTRIDDFCYISAGEEGIEIGHNVHIAAYASLGGKALIHLGDYSGISRHVAIFSSSDDFSGRAMTNPTVPPKYTSVRSLPVHLGNHVIVGAGTVILPGVTIGEGASIGAMSLVVSDCLPFTSYKGNPALSYKERKRDFMKLAEEYERSVGITPAPRLSP
jgi:acetyltransferase-like isoleucine patch superfamily enzyme